MHLTYVNPPTGYTRPENEPHSEYPKYVHVAGKPSVIANDPGEEAAILAGAVVVEKALEPEAATAPIPTLVGGNDEEVMLRKIAAEKGIALDGRWSLARIRKVVNAATVTAASQ
jgi:hypothetical protein